MRQRQPFFREARSFVIGIVVCGLLALIVTVAILWVIAVLLGLVSPLFRG